MRIAVIWFLSIATAFVAIAGARAADVSIKTEPTGYVKVCSLYGEGFYYIPGTETLDQNRGLRPFTGRVQ